MTLTSDYLVDRRRLRRQVTFWRVLTALLALAALLGIAASVFGWRPDQRRPHLARVAIEGLITGKQETIDLLKRVGRSDAKAVLLRINSGGGTTAGSEALYHEVRRLAEKKPVIAIIDGIGASGAYMTAMGAERIVANGSALVGSIGVIAQYPNLTKLLDTLGVKVEAVRSSPLKAMPSGLEPTPPEARAALEATIKDTYAWFRGLVRERRQLDDAGLDQVSDGRVFTGRQAIGLKLIDAIGGEDDAIEWLVAQKGIEKGLLVRDYKPSGTGPQLPGLISIEALARMLGLAPSADFVRVAEAALGANALDGLISLWHPMHAKDE